MTQASFSNSSEGRIDSHYSTEFILGKMWDSAALVKRLMLQLPLHYQWQIPGVFPATYDLKSVV